MKKILLVGRRFGKLIVNEEAGRRSNKVMWNCLCDCGKKTTVAAYKLTKGTTRSCGCLRVENGESKLNDISGLTFGALTIIEQAGRHISKGGQQHTMWRCKCSCGNETILPYNKIKRGERISCADCGAKRKPKHKTGAEHFNWRGYKDILGAYWARIRSRARNHNMLFQINIEYCWDLYEKQNKKCALSGKNIYFAKTTKDLDEGKNTASLDRIDSDIDYVIGNVQWVHKDINYMKQQFDQDYYIEMCRLVVENNKVVKS